MFRRGRLAAASYGYKERGCSIALRHCVAEYYQTAKRKRRCAITAHCCSLCYLQHYRVLSETSELYSRRGDTVPRIQHYCAVYPRSTRRRKVTINLIKYTEYTGCFTYSVRRHKDVLSIYSPSFFVQNRAVFRLYIAL